MLNLKRVIKLIVSLASILSILLLIGLRPGYAVDKQVKPVADGVQNCYSDEPASTGTQSRLQVDYIASYCSPYYHGSRLTVMKFDIRSMNSYELRNSKLFMFGGRGSSGGNPTTYVYHYNFDGWSEAAVPYPSGSQIQYLTQKTISNPLGPDYIGDSIWLEYDIGSALPQTSYADGYISLVVKNMTNNASASFVSRNSVTWDGSKGKEPYLALKLWGETETSNPSFDDCGSVWCPNSVWTPDGTANLTIDPNDASNTILDMTTNSPVSISQVLDTPQTAFYVKLSHEFKTLTGQLDVSLTLRDGTKTTIGSLQAPASLTSGLQPAWFSVENPALLYQDNVTLKLTFDGVSGSKIWIDDVIFTDEIDPTPTTVRATASANGALDVTTASPQIVTAGTTTQFKFNANAGYRIAAISGCGVDYSNSDISITTHTVTTQRITAECTVEASFVQNNFTLSYTANSNGSIDGTTPQSVSPMGDGTPVTAQPDTGYHFTNWSDASTDNPRTDTDVNSDISVSANFAVNTYTVSASVFGGHGTIDPVGPQAADYGATPSFNVAAETGYQLSEVTGSCSGSLNGTIYTTDAITGNCDVVASFELIAAPVITEGDSGVSVTMDEDGNPLSFSLILHASDANTHDTLSWSISLAASTGTAAADATGESVNVTYVPPADYHGSDSFDVQVSDGGLTDTIMVSVTINPIDDLPFVASPIVDYVVDEDAADEILDLSAIFEDIDSTVTLSVQTNTNPDLLSTALNDSDLTLSFLLNQHGSADITIRATADGESVDDTFSVTVDPVNDLPVLTSAKKMSYKKDEPVVGQLTATDVEDDTPVFTLVGGADLAKFTILNGNDLNFIDAADANGKTEYQLDVRISDGGSDYYDEVIMVVPGGCTFFIIPVVPGRMAVICL